MASYTQQRNSLFSDIGLFRNYTRLIGALSHLDINEETVMHVRENFRKQKSSILGPRSAQPIHLMAACRNNFLHRSLRWSSNKSDLFRKFVFS